MNVNDRIKQIMIDKSLSPSVFADEIGVQRSSISHILSGRNRPSFDIIQKVIRRYPDLGYDWIMEENTLEDSTKPKTAGIRASSETSVPLRSRESAFSQRRQPVGQAENTPTPQPAPVTTVMPTSPAATPEKAVEKILIFYTDGTFREFTPAG